MPARFPRTFSVPAVTVRGPGGLTRLWRKLLLSASWKLYLVLVVKAPLIRLNVSFLVLAILEVTFGKIREI